jgi:hypothetical protein
MRWCCFSLLVVFAIGYALGSMTEPPQPRQSVVCTIVEWIHWFRRRPKEEFHEAPQSYRALPAAEADDGHPRIDHYGAI